MCSIRVLFWIVGATFIITTVSSYEPQRSRRNPFNHPPPLHLFPGPHPVFTQRQPNKFPDPHPVFTQRQTTNRVIMTRPFKHQFGPMPHHSKPVPTFKYPSQHNRPHSGPPKFKKPSQYPRGPPPQFQPHKKNPYYGQSQGVVTTSFNKPNRPRPQHFNQPYYTNDETPKETIATFVNRPTSNPQQGQYNGYTKNPWVSYGPPYPPKPFKSYGVYSGEDDEVIQGSQQVGASIKYQGNKGHVNFKPDYPKINMNPSIEHESTQYNYNPSTDLGGQYNYDHMAQGSAHVNFNPNGKTQVNFNSQRPKVNKHTSAQVTASVRYPGPVKVSTLNYPEAVGTQIKYPSASTSSTSHKRRRPQRQEESAAVQQLTPTTSKPFHSISGGSSNVQFPTPETEVENYDHFLQETFAPDLSGQQPSAAPRPKPESKRQKPRHRHYEVHDQPEEREGHVETDYEGWQPAETS